MAPLGADGSADQTVKYRQNDQATVSIPAGVGPRAFTMVTHRDACRFTVAPA